MASSTVENYIKSIYLAEQEDVPVTMGQLAKDLNVTPGTATSMVKQLAKKELIRYEPRIGVNLSGKGRQMAIRIVRKHRLIELFLADTLGLPWGQVHEEADRIEHAISEEVLQHLDRFLGFPAFDPHGDPIPHADGTLPQDRNLLPLSESPLHSLLKVARISDQSCDFLEFMEEHDLKPGTELTLQARSKAADSTTICLKNGHSTALGLSAAAKIFVERTQ